MEMVVVFGCSGGGAFSVSRCRTATTMFGMFVAVSVVHRYKVGVGNYGVDDGVAATE